MKTLIIMIFAVVSISFNAHGRTCSGAIFPAIKQQMICMYGQNLGSCGFLADRFLKGSSFKDSIRSAKTYYRQNNQSVIGNVITDELRHQVIEAVEEEIVDTAIYQTLKQMGLRYTGKVGASTLAAIQIGRVILRRVSLVTSVGSILLIPDGNSGCSEIRDKYINRATGSCNEDYNFNENVVGFLMMKFKDRAKIMKQTSGVCGYYQRFNDTLIKEDKDQREALSLTCKKDGFDLKTQKANAWMWNKQKKDYQVRYNMRFRRKPIATISLKSKWTGKRYVKYRFDRQGMVKKYDKIRTDADELYSYKETKMEVFAAYNCCKEVAAGRKTCLRNYK